MLFPTSLRGRSACWPVCLTLAVALLLPCARSLAQSHAAPPTAEPAVPASDPTQAPSPQAAGGNVSAGSADQLFSGVATAVKAPAPPPLPLAFEAFASDYTPKKDLPQRWLNIEAGFIELDEPPPLRPGMQAADRPTIFAVNSLPNAVLSTMRAVEFSSLIGAKSRYENVTMLDHDPHGHALPFTLPMGKIVYFLARDLTQDGLDFDFYYYDSHTLQWILSPVDVGLMLPQPAVIMQKQSLVVPADKYVLMLTTMRAGPPHPGSTARPITLYGYVVLYMHAVQGSAAPGGHAPNGDVLGGPAPPVGDVLAAPPPSSPGDVLAPVTPDSSSQPPMDAPVFPSSTPP